MMSIFAITATELRIALRNRWVVTAIALMTLFSLMLAFAGSAPVGTLAADRLTVTVTGLATLCVYLVPLVALLISYDAFAGEVDRGTLPLLLTYPVSRWQILAGKFTSQLIVVALAIVIGTGASAVAIWMTEGVSSAGLIHLARLQWTAILLGAVFLAVGNSLSVLVRQPGTAASLAVSVWVVAVVMADVALLGAVIADDGGAFTKSVFPWLLAASPTDAFRLFNLLAVETSTVGGIVTAPQTLNLPVATPIIALAMWLTGLLALTAFIFRRTEP
jgi:Cu-processing system permease protein